MRNTILPFDELMKAVLEQLKSQKYMDSTLTVYRRTYNRIHIFLNHHGTDIYTHELGKACQPDDSKVSLSNSSIGINRSFDPADFSSDLSQLNTGIVSQALLTFSNKDAYARIRQFLNYLAEKGILEVDLSRIVPHYKRGTALPTTYTPDEISRVEASRCIEMALTTSQGICNVRGIPVFSWVILMYPVLKLISDSLSFAMSPARSPIRDAK